MGNPFLKRITITHVAANLTILFFAGLFLATGLKNRWSEGKSASSVRTVDYNVYFYKDRYKGAQLRLFQLGELIVPTGKIIVGGPFEVYDSDPLKRQINPGKYPVIACIAKTKNWGERYAAVKLEISKSRAVKWELAVTAAQDTKILKKGQIFGFAVDAGLGCFADEQTRDFFNQFDAPSAKKDTDQDVYYKFIAPEFKKNALNPNDPEDIGNWVNFYLPNKPDQNIIMFTSGYGDGFYASYWGLDNKGEVCSLVIDFAVL